MRISRRSLTAVLPLALAAGLAAPGAPGASAHPSGRSSASAATAPSRAQLKAAVMSALRGHGGRLSFSVSSPTVGTIGHTPNHASAPASNEKLFTATTLLQLAGSGFHYVTPVAGTALIVDHVLTGDLVVRGSGDPTLTRASLMSLAKRLHALGLRRVTGHLIVDDTRYSHRTRVSGWKRNFVPTESGPVSAFTVDHNAWRHTKAYDEDPTPANGRLFRTILERRHITIGRVVVEPSPAIAKTFVSHSSGDLATIVRSTLTQSLNFNAEMMFREAGARLTGHGSPASGARAVATVAQQLGVDTGTVHDGSGLSYTDRETPATLMRWLRALQRKPAFAATYQSVFDGLPLSCETGTLVHRMCRPSTRGRVRAKTGTLTHISALSGYVVPRDEPQGLPVTFSFLATGVHDYLRLYNHIDAAVAVLRKQG